MRTSELLAFSSGIVSHFQEHTVGLEVKMAVFGQNITCLKMKSGTGGRKKDHRGTFIFLLAVNPIFHLAT